MVGAGLLGLLVAIAACTRPPVDIDVVDTDAHTDVEDTDTPLAFATPPEAADLDDAAGVVRVALTAERYADGRYGWSGASAPLVTLRCVHPWVTALEKIDAIARRFPRANRPASSFVRHYEDIARIVALRDRLPVLEGGLTTLRNDLLAAKDIRGLPDRTDAAFQVDATAPRWQELALAWEAIDPWFWGPRSTLEEACEAIGALLDEVGHR